MTGSVGSVAAGGITASSIASSAITSAKFATDAIDSEMQSQRQAFEIAAASLGPHTRTGHSRNPGEAARFWPGVRCKALYRVNVGGNVTDRLA